jgi:hypothetical protein
MPIHDWTCVGAGLFHAFHHGWITDLARALNRGLLPSNYYALPEHNAAGPKLDVLVLQGSGKDTRPVSEPDQYAAKAKAVVVRHSSDHRVIAIVEIVSPGNKNNRHGLRAFVSKAVEMLRAGVHLLIIDLFPPGPRDPQGIHKPIWDEWVDSEFALPPDRPLTLVAYLADSYPEAFIEPTAVGSSLADMPLFLTPDVYVPVSLEATYQSAFDGLSAYWRGVLNAPAAP